MRYKAIYVKDGELKLGRECKDVPSCNASIGNRVVGHVMYRLSAPNDIKIMRANDYIEEWLRA